MATVFQMSCIHTSEAHGDCSDIIPRVPDRPPRKRLLAARLP